MKTGTDDQRKKIAAGVLGVLAASLVVYQLYGIFGGPSAPPPPAPVAVVSNPGGKLITGKAAVKIGTTSAQLDPTLHMDSMLVTEGLVYSGSGRNIFAPGNEPETKIPEAVHIARNEPPKLIDKPFVPPPPVTCPPTCPPVNLKFFGTATNPATGVRRAFLLNGDDVFLASAGDVVQRKYRVVSIAANSILVEDIPNANKQTLPLLGN